MGRASNAKWRRRHGRLMTWLGSTVASHQQRAGHYLQIFRRRRSKLFRKRVS